MPKQKVLITLGGADMPPEVRRMWVEKADVLIAADSGADRLMEIGRHANVLIGDLDSVSEDGRISAEKTIHLSEQESTDFEKALRYCEEAYPEGEILVICSEGDQLDHSLDAFSCAAGSHLRVSFGLRRGLTAVVKQGITEANLPAGSRISVIPLTVCSSVDLDGVKWPLANVTLEPLGRSSVSNVSDGVVRLALGGGVALFFAEVEPGTWPSEVFG